MDMPVSQAQTEMREDYCSGGAGILASSLAWCAAASTAVLVAPDTAVWVLLIGGRYLVFATLFGMRLYWMLGLTLAAAGLALGGVGVPSNVSAGAGAAIELTFALVCLAQHRRWVRPDSSFKAKPLCA